MASIDHCNELARRIRHHWKNGLALDQGVRHYLASVLGADSGEKIAAILGDPQQCRSAGIVDLLLVPDRRFALDLEDLIEAADFGPADKMAVVARLQEPAWWLEVVADPALPACRVNVAAEQALALVDRIGVGRAIDKQLALDIKAFVPEAFQAAARVCLRQRILPPGRHQTAFLRRFLHAGTPCGWVFPEQWEKVLDLMEQLPPTEPVCSALGRRRAVLAAALDSREDHRSRLNSAAMETLMLQGMRAPYLDGAATAETLTLIDRLCRALCP